jgi:hypothetical protein
MRSVYIYASHPTNPAPTGTSQKRKKMNSEQNEVPALAGNAPLTFQKLAAMEPGLDRLLAKALAYHNNTPRQFCANAVWYGYGHQPGLKRQLERLVGWDRPGKHPVLSSPEAYELGYETVYEALPPCDHPGPFCS